MSTVSREEGLSQRALGRRMIATTVAIILIGCILRSPIVAIAPVIGSIENNLGISPSIAGLLTGIPILCFAVATPAAMWILRRGGTTFTITVCIVGELAGWVIRSTGYGLAPVLIGTVILGVSITVGNVVVPVVIRRDYSERRAGFMTGVYISALNVGSMTAALSTAPLEPALGWRGATLSCAVFGIAACAVWMGTRGWRSALIPNAVATEQPTLGIIPPQVFRSLTVWVLAVAFAGQVFAYYAVTAWLPQLLSDELHYSATVSGAISSIFQITAIVGGLGSPVIAHRFGNLAGIVTIGLFWLAVPIGFLLAPEQWGLWVALGGVGQGGGLTMILLISSKLSQNDRHAASVNGLVQATGYAIACVAPTMVGAVHGVTGDWNTPLVLILLGLLIYGLLGSWGAIRVQSRSSANVLAASAVPCP